MANDKKAHNSSGGLCAILNLNTLSAFWNKSYLTLRKPALQERQKFFYTVVHFFTFVEHVTKNNLIIPQFQRYPRCSSFFYFLKDSFRSHWKPYCS